MNNEQQRGQQSGKNQVPPMTDKKEFKKNTKQKDIEADEDMGGSCSSKGGSCGSGMSSEDDGDVEA